MNDQPWTLGRILYVVLQAIGSLKVTTWLFALSIPLVYFGTMAQADASLLSVIWSYFRSFYVWVPFHIFVKDLPGGFPYPGGWLLGALLLVNLLAAHCVRFRSTFRHPGIILIHTGVIVIMVSEFWTGLVSVESHMTIEEGKTANYVEETGVAELAISRKLEVDGETYHFALRPRRRYRDYSIELIEFTHELYPNTNTPKRFESRVRIIDPSHDENRVTVISMNAPMTYRSETYYQSSFLPGDAGTVLQVVYNPSKPLPYAGFFMVMAGMLFHFGLKLVRFAQHILAQRRLA